jgi:hypothetical protein
VGPDQQDIQALAQRILVKAAHKLGGVAALATHLGISEATLGEYVTGKLVPPADVILKAVGPLLDGPPSHLWDEPGSTPDASDHEHS